MVRNAGRIANSAQTSNNSGTRFKIGCLVTLSKLRCGSDGHGIQNMATAILSYVRHAEPGSRPCLQDKKHSNCACGAAFASPVPTTHRRRRVGTLYSLMKPAARSQPRIHPRSKTAARCGVPPVPRGSPRRHYNITVKTKFLSYSKKKK